MRTMVSMSLKQALRLAEDAAGTAASFRPTTESVRQRIQEAEEQAAELYNNNPPVIIIH